MRKLFGAGLALLSLSLWSGAYAQTITRGWVSPAVASSPSACPFGADANDGCLTAPAGAQILLANFLTTSAASGQNFSSMASRTYNIACVDYACGPTTPQASAADPLLNIPPNVGFDGCSPPTDHTTYWTLDCGGANMPAHTWTHLNFGPFPGRTGTSNDANKGPVFVNFNTSVVNAQIFDDVWFSVSNACEIPAQGSFIVSQVGGTFPITIRNASFDGNDANCRYTSKGIGGFVLHTTGSKTVERTYMHDITQRVASWDGGNTTTDVFRWSVIDNFNTVPWAGHGEIGLWSSLSGQKYNSFSVRYVAVNYSSLSCACGTATMFLTNGFPGTDFGTFNYDHVFNATNIVGGSGTPLAGTIQFHTSVNVATGVHNLLTIESISAGSTIRQGTNILIGGGLNLIAMKNISGGGGAGGTWTVACAEPANGTTCPGITSDATTGGDFPNTDIASTSATVGNETTSVACIYAGADSFTSLNITASYCDRTGSGTNSHWFAAGAGDAVCTTPAVFTGNKDPTTGSAINAWTTTGAGATC